MPNAYKTKLLVLEKKLEQIELGFVRKITACENCHANCINQKLALLNFKNSNTFTLNKEQWQQYSKLEFESLYPKQTLTLEIANHELNTTINKFLRKISLFLVIIAIFTLNLEKIIEFINYGLTYYPMTKAISSWFDIAMIVIFIAACGIIINLASKYVAKKIDFNCKRTDKKNGYKLPNHTLIY